MRPTLHEEVEEGTPGIGRMHEEMMKNRFC
jgi:hypothetical protein